MTDEELDEHKKIHVAICGFDNFDESVWGQIIAQAKEANRLQQCMLKFGNAAMTASKNFQAACKQIKEKLDDLKTSAYRKGVDDAADIAWNCLDGYYADCFRKSIDKLKEEFHV